jgi:gluconate 2-dehydrogenase
LLTFLGACKKVSRRKGETASRSTAKNGYTPKTNHNHPQKKTPQSLNQGVFLKLEA